MLDLRTQECRHTIEVVSGRPGRHAAITAGSYEWQQLVDKEEYVFSTHTSCQEEG